MTVIHVTVFIMGRHKEWRKLVKKLRRKRIRCLKAEERNEIARIEREHREKSPSHIAWLKEQEALEAFAEEEERRLAAERQLLWEAEEVAAQERWCEQQIRLERAYAEKAKQELLIREEWEREQKKIKEEKERKEKVEEEKKKLQDELLAQIDAFISGKADLPVSTIVSTETQPGRAECPFFSKTGACRFKDSCSRNHIRPGISKVLLFTNFYEHFGIQSFVHNEYDTDVGLEYEDSDTYMDFLEFYNDILPEFETCGEIRQLKVCCNHEPHLRGNVYVEYFDERNALKAYQLFQGRFFGGRQLSVTFSNIPSWKSALCGLFHKKRCPKGLTCNFLHVFKNPHNAFREADFDASPKHLRESPPRRKRLRSPESWRWSISPERSDASKRTKSSSRSKHFKRLRERSKERYSSVRDKVSSSSRRKRNRSRSRDDNKNSSCRSSHSSSNNGAEERSRENPERRRRSRLSCNSGKSKSENKAKSDRKRYRKENVDNEKIDSSSKISRLEDTTPESS